MNATSRTGNIFEDVAIKAAVRLASTSVSLTLEGEQPLDGFTAVDGDRVLLTAQTDPTENGIWQVSTGLWHRPTDARNNTDFIDGTLVPVSRGNMNAGMLFMLRCTDSPIVIDTSELVFIAQTDVVDELSVATSTSSVTIGIGSKTFSVQPDRTFEVDQWMLAFQTSNPDNVMLGKITTYAGSSLIMTVVSIGGAGTFTDWTIGLVNSAALAGRMPPVGTGNVTGPGSSTAGHIPVFADATGKVLSDSGIAPGLLAGKSQIQFGDINISAIPDTALVPGSAPLPFVGTQPNDNLHLVNDVSNPNRDINVTSGRCRADDDSTNLHLKAAMVKRLDQAWTPGGAAGAPAGGCDGPGTKGASQTWHQYLIGKIGLTITSVSRTSNVATITCTGHGGGVGGTCRAYGMGQNLDALAVITAVTTNSISYANAGPDMATTAVNGTLDLFDILASQSYPVPTTMPSGWTAKQSLGSFLTDGSGNIRAVLQIGDRFTWTNIITDFSGAGPGATNLTITVPNGLRVLATVQAANSGDGGLDAGARIYSPDQADIAISTSDGSCSFGIHLITGAAQPRLGGTVFDVPTNASAQIRAATAASSGFLLRTVSYRDPRRRLF